MLLSLYPLQTHTHIYVCVYNKLILKIESFTLYIDGKRSGGKIDSKTLTGNWMKITLFFFHSLKIVVTEVSQKVFTPNEFILIKLGEY